MRFLRADLLWWLVGAIGVVVAARWLLRPRFAASTTVRWLGASKYRASILRRLPFLVLLASLVLIAGALMDPVLPYSEAEVRSTGLDIVMLLDLSSSMQEEMERVRAPRTLTSLTFNNAGTTAARKPGETRLEAVKRAIRNFVVRRRDDRIALIVFSDNAYVVSPLTFDHDYVLRYIDLVDDQILRGEGMTAIGDGLALSNYLLYRQAHGIERRNQVIVLFTDGENNKGRDPIEVLKESNDAKIRVHFVGVDLEDEIRNKTQVQRLLEAVRMYGGRYFNANTASQLEAASRTIDTIEKGVLSNRVLVRDVPVFQWFALPALICLVGAIALRAIPYFVDQT